MLKSGDVFGHLSSDRRPLADATSSQVYTPRIRSLTDCKPLHKINDAILGLLVVRDEFLRIRPVLDYHRSLGVQHFLVVDNGSSDGTVNYLLSRPDVYLFVTNDSYRVARNGMAWVEQLLNQYGSGRWCLVIDADEFLVYPGCEQIKLEPFCHLLETKGLNCLATTFIDMYGKSLLIHSNKGNNLLKVSPYFDRSGYYNFPVPGSTFPRIFGGPRARIFWPEVRLREQQKILTNCIKEVFDEELYLTANPDVSETGEFKNGWQHYNLIGRSQGRPFPLKKSAFDEPFYRTANPDIDAALRIGEFKSGWQHYKSNGHAEGGRQFRSKPPAFWPEEQYLAGNPDVVAAIVSGQVASGFDHYFRFGQFEGRFTSHPPLLTQVPLLRWEIGMKIHPGRHIVEGARWGRSDAVGGALLHFKLMHDLVRRAETVKATGEDTPESPHWGEENARYSEVLRNNPRVRARVPFCGVKDFLARLIGVKPPISIRYRNSQQLVALGLITPTNEL